MINSITSALSGLNNASQRVEQGAQNIAQGGTDGRVIEDIVDIKVAQTSYEANLSVLKTANELTKELIDSFDEKV
jgi:flagellar basal body rod protein FlgC